MVSSDFVTLTSESCERAFAPLAERSCWAAPADPAVFARVWATVEATGFLDILTMDDSPWAERVAATFAILRQAGRCLLSAPLGETMAARMLARSAGLAISDGPAALAIGDGERFTRVPYGRFAKALICGIAPENWRLSVDGMSVTQGANLASEPRDDLMTSAKPERDWIPRLAEDPMLWGLAMRAAQIAGALEGMLALTVDYARTRKQFGRPIGQFQAVQQNLSVFAGQTAAASTAAAYAFSAAGTAQFRPAALAAAVRCGEAAGISTAIAHQTLGAIGITHEHDLRFYTARLHSWRTEYQASAAPQQLGHWAAAHGADGLWAAITT
ncbi:MAG TPA: hypothetical protein DCL54_18305 [Alphaproteobacteria bacterium]|nr:hypothetical protein [Alphaproteobacteria bacterium]HAJ48534.1 hypothetical protein [Alphaproteobacteria bacterium]